MKRKRLRYLVSTFWLVCTATSAAYSQSVYQPYSFQFYQKFSALDYAVQTGLHTAIKPFFFSDSLLKKTYDSLTGAGSKPGLFNCHQLQKTSANATFYADLLPDFGTGRDLAGHQAVSRQSLGLQAGGSIGSNFVFYGNFFASETRFSDYLANYINSTGYIPGQGKDHDPNQVLKGYQDWNFLLSYTPVKFINISLGKDKTFIGDGYRSMLLSDFATSYPFGRISAKLGQVQYMAMYAYLQNPNAPLAANGDQRNKWGYFQYLDWNISNRLSVGAFQNVMEATTSTGGQKRGFNFSLASPFVFLVPENNIDNDPGKNLLGLTAKYKIFDKTILYGQFALNEFHSKDFFSGNGSVTNKSAYQFGFRGADLFRVKNLNCLAEFNTARPFTYASFDQTSNYSQDDQSLAHPLGANFREWLAILDYSRGRFDLQAQVNYAFYGLDEAGLDEGQNIFEPYTQAAQPYGNYVAQGLLTHLYYGEFRLAYVLNPANNLRLELNGTFRQEQNRLVTNRSAIVSIGLRSSFRDIYRDF